MEFTPTKTTTSEDINIVAIKSSATTNTAISIDKDEKTDIPSTTMSTMTSNDTNKITTNAAITGDTEETTMRKEPESDIPQNIEKFDLFLNPDKQKERKTQVDESMAAYDKKFGSLDLEKSYKPLFELLWYSQMPCIDVKGITSEELDELSFLKRCYWKNVPISCSAIFQKRPTDRGMCCSFNMKKAETILKGSKYTDAISSTQAKEEANGFENTELPESFLSGKEPKSEAGQNKGLTLVLDRHSNRISASTVIDDFQGFVTVIDGSDKYPLTSSSSLIARPGYVTNMEIRSVKVQALQEIRDFVPEKRNCYFPDEYSLEMHKLYSQSNCILECKVKYANACMKTCMNSEDSCNCRNVPILFDAIWDMKDSCTPWFYPVTDNKTVQMCNPWNMLKFIKIIDDDIPEEACKYCLPECTTTVYETATSYAKYQKCDHTNTGTNTLCDMVNETMNPAPWTYLAQNEFANASPNGSLPWYLQTDSTKWKVLHDRKTKFPDQRRKVTDIGTENSALFISELKENPTYNAFENDIGTVNIFFGKSYTTRYIKKNRMSEIDFLAQVGGAVGLAMGISIISLVELIYWFTLRLFRYGWK